MNKLNELEKLTDAMAENHGSFDEAYKVMDAFEKAANPQTIKQLIALCRMQHEAFEALYAGTDTRELDGKALELFDSALAAYEQIMGEK